MTFAEFIYPLRNSPQRELVAAALYYLKHQEGLDTAGPTDIRDALTKAGVGKARDMNTTRALNLAIPNVNRLGPRGVWEITGTGEAHVRKLLALPEPDAAPQTAHDVTTLQALAEAQTDDNVQGYIEEAIKCLQADALRAAVVFLWSGAVYTIREAMGKRRPSARLMRR